MSDETYDRRHRRWGKAVTKWLIGQPPASVSFTERRSGPSFGGSPNFGDHSLDFSKPQNTVYTCIM